MAIDLTDYGRTSAQRGWGAGWPSCAGASGDLATIEGNNPDGSVAARVTVRKRLARLVDLLLDACERRGYDLWANQCGGFNCRPIAGTRTASNHSWGVAVDLNWTLNPYRRPMTTNVPGWMVALWNRYGFAWGGHYRGTPDPMHFEFMGTPQDADAMTALAILELTGVEPPTRPTLRRGATGAAVRELQALLGVTVDGTFGPGTEAAVRRFQEAHGLPVDGVVGPRTWAALREEDMPSIQEIEEAARRAVRAELRAPVQRAGEGQSGVTNEEAITAWTDHAWALGRETTTLVAAKLAERLDVISSRLDAIDQRLDALAPKAAGEPD